MDRQPRVFDCLRVRQLFALPVLVTALSAASMSAQAGPRCGRIWKDPTGVIAESSSYNDVLAIMEKDPYTAETLPTIPLKMWKWFGRHLSFFVGKRSKEILRDRRDYRERGMEKPIHPMGVGLEGVLRMHPSGWSGIFAGGEFPVLARASLSQGNPLKTRPDGSFQKRSTALALKVFGTHDKNARVKTANAVFQNDLNGLLGRDGKPLNYLESDQTNQPNLDFTQMRESYEFLTLIGVAFGSFSTPRDMTSKFPYVNPQIRPVHSLAEMGVSRPEDVRTPTWIRIQPRLKEAPLAREDFRHEIVDTLNRDQTLEYDIFVSDFRDSRGQIQWIPVGELVFNRAILSKGVDQNLLFPHDSLNSAVTGREFQIPGPSKQYDSVPDDIQ